MDINFSGEESFAFSDIAPPSHVSGLESFSDFEPSECESLNGEHEQEDARDSGVEEEGTSQGLVLPPLDLDGKDFTSDRFSFGLQSIPTGDIKEFWAAIESAKAQLGMPLGSDKDVSSSVAQDESSLGILHLDSMQDISAFGSSSDMVAIATQPANSKDDTLEVENDLPYADEYNEATTLSHSSSSEKNMELRPDTGQPPDTFFSPRSAEENGHGNKDESGAVDTTGLSKSNGDLQFMLQTRSGSGDGGELIDRVSLTSSISFLQSQTFPDSIFSQSLSSTSRGLGSGMDSHSASDADDNQYEDDDDDATPVVTSSESGLMLGPHNSGDGSNGIDHQPSLPPGRPGLEGANSDPEDGGPIRSRPSSEFGGSHAGSIELRQSGEGGDVLPFIPGDGGGGGDGSSGHSSEDDQTDSDHELELQRTSPPMSSPGEGAEETPQSQPSSPGERQLSRGPPVGHAASDTPISSMSSTPQSQSAEFSSSSLNNFDVLAASTPMVRPGQAFNFDQSGDLSAIASQYLQATTKKDVLRQRAMNQAAHRSQFPPQFPQDGSFHLSQALGGGLDSQDNTLTELPSLPFEMTGMTPRPHYFAEDEQEQTLIAKTPARGNDSTLPQNKTLGSSQEPADLSNSQPRSHTTGIPRLPLADTSDNSLLWKSTPRDEDESLCRATPGIVFKGNTRPSPVDDRGFSSQSSNAGSREGSPNRNIAIVRPETRQSTTHGSTSQSKRYSGYQRSRKEYSESSTLPARASVEDSSSNRTMTPGGSAEQVVPFSSPAPSWANDVYEFPPGEAFGGDSQMGSVINPFEDEAGMGDWSGVQAVDFDVHGDAEAILAADEESFVKEHQFDVPDLSTTAQAIKDAHEWTIPDESHLIARPSLLRVMGINDPNNEGEVRISFGAIISAGSEELGSLSNKDPQRPRPHFGDGRSINTPSPQPPPKLIRDSIDQQRPPDATLLLKYENTPLKQTNVNVSPQGPGTSSTSMHKSNIPTVKKNSRALKKRRDSARRRDESTFESEKARLDEQYKKDIQPRSRSGSQSSTQSSSSRSSVPSVIDNSKTASFRRRRGSADQPSGEERADRNRYRSGGSRYADGSMPKSRTSAKQGVQVKPDPRLGSSSKYTGRQADVRTSRKGSVSKENRSGSTGSAEGGDARPVGHTQGAQRRLMGKKQVQQSGASDQSKTQDLSTVSSINTSLASLLSSSSGLGSMTQEELATFIAAAIKVDPEQIGKLLIAVSKAKPQPSEVSTSEVSTVNQSTSINFCETISRAEDESVTAEHSPERERLSSIMPIASSSPHDESSPNDEQDSTVVSPTSALYESSALSPNRQVTASNTIDSSVFVQDSPENVSVIERDTTTIAPTNDVSLSPAPDPFAVQVDPYFGKTYTIRGQKVNAAPQTDVDPLKERTSKIEKRLNQSFTPHDSSDQIHSFEAISTVSDTSAETILESPTRNQPSRLQKSFDSVLVSHSPQPDNQHRHSWPKSTGTPQRAEALPRHMSSGTTAMPLKLVTVSVQQDIGTQMYPGISSLGTAAPGQQGSLVNPSPLGYGPQTGYGQNLNTPTLGGTFPLPPIGFQHISGPPTSTFPGHVQGPGQFPSRDMYGNLGMTAVTPLMNNYGQVQSYLPLAGTQQVPQSYTVSTAIGPRVSTMNHPLQQPQNAFLSTAQGQAFASTAPPFGLLQLGQPLAGQERPMTLDHRSVAMDSQQSRTTAGSLTPVVIPGDVKLPPVCCMGVSTRSLLSLHNSSSKWVYCVVRIASCLVNGMQVTSSVDNPWSIPSKLIINPHTTVQVEVVFKPKCTGLHVLQLHVSSSPVSPSGGSETLPQTVMVETVAENPGVHILPEDSQIIDFGGMTASSKHSRPLRLVNRGKAAVPIRLTITPNATSLHCFSFANADSSPKKGDGTSSTGVISSKGMLSVHRLWLDGNSSMEGAIEPSITWILFQAPQKGDAGPNLGLPDEFNARVDVEIDSEEGLIIGSVLLKATVGVPRLHIPKSVQELTLSSAAGQRVSRSFPLRNAGNIDIQVDLRVSTDSDYFTVTPTRSALRPKQEVEVTVQFKASKPDLMVDSTLEMFIKPDGPKYDVPLRGMVVSEKAPTSDEVNLLLCNKTAVCWGGVAIGKAVQQKIVLKNNAKSPSKKMKLQLSIQGQHSDFQLQNTFGKVDEHSLASIVSLAPQEELPVHILFAPSSLGLISSALIIRTLSGGTKSKVPLHGCGGTSNLILVDTRKLSEGYISNIGEVSLGKTNLLQVTVKNTGTRAAFVTALCYSDVMTQTTYPASHFSITPNHFILPERTSKQLTIAFQPLESDAIKCQQEVSTVASVAFYFGDEFIRSQYKRYIQRNELPTVMDIEGPLNGINFLTSYKDEDKVLQDVTYPSVHQWSRFFQSCVSRLLLTLVGSPPRPQEPIAKPNRSLDLVPMQGPVENVPLIDAGTSNTEVQGTEMTTPESWTAVPDHLVLTASKTLCEKGTGKLQIINFSERPLVFEFSWPPRYLTITPDRGQVPPRSQVMIVMSPRPTLYSSGVDLPWSGVVHITCDGAQRTVRVQIREELILENSPYQPGASNMMALESGEITPFAPPLPTAHLPVLIVKTKQVKFRDTLVGRESVSELVVENTTNAKVSWDLSSVAPAYVKPPGSGDVFRTTYPAFSFHRRSGTADAKATLKIPIKFQPRDGGQYSQHWDLQFKQDGFKRVHKQRVEVVAQAIPKDSSSAQQVHRSSREAELNQAGPGNELKTHHREPSLHNGPSSKPSTSEGKTQDSQANSTAVSLNRSKRSKPRGVYVAESEVHFPDTLVGQTSEVTVKLCNNSDDTVPVKLVSPRSPFSITNTKVSVRPCRFVRLPIKFSPVDAGVTYEAVLVFMVSPDKTFQVLLRGKSPASEQ